MKTAFGHVRAWYHSAYDIHTCISLPATAVKKTPPNEKQATKVDMYGSYQGKHRDRDKEILLLIARRERTTVDVLSQECARLWSLVHIHEKKRRVVTTNTMRRGTCTARETGAQKQMVWK